MNWIRLNKFLAGYLLVLVAGAVALGVMLFLAYGRHTGISESYDKSASELQRLEGLKPYPNAKNLDALKKQKEEYASQVTGLMNKMAAMEFPPEPTTPNGFQDRLQKVVSEIKTLAAENSVELPEGFYLGFDQYQNEQPKPEAAAPLERQLKAIEFLVRKLIELRINKITSIERDLLPEETGAKDDPKQLVRRHAVNLAFASYPGVFRRALNAITTAGQFYIVRTVFAQNEKLEGPARAAGGEAATTAESQPAAPSLNDIMAAAGTAPGTEGAPPAKRLEFIVGEEKIEFAVRIEIVDFELPAAQDKPAGAKPPA